MKVSVSTVIPNDLFDFNCDLIAANKKYWMVRLTIKTGLDSTSYRYKCFENEENAKEYAARNYIGKILDDVPLQENKRDIYLQSTLLRDIYLGRGSKSYLSNVYLPPPDLDNFYPKCCEILFDAGVKSTALGGSSEKVLKWLGDEQILELQAEFKDTWEVMGELEYCMYHFPRSSIACRAAEVMAHHFITHNGEAFGYLYRELLMMLGQAEVIATANIETQKKAGKGGGDKSNKLKTDRLNHFMKEIEALSDLYPRINEEHIVKQAFDNAVKNNPKLWKQGKGQRDDYLSKHICSEEPYKSKYYSIFNKTA